MRRVPRTSRRSTIPTIAGALAVVAILALPANASPLAAWERTLGTPATFGWWGHYDTHIDHIVIVTMENHAYDNFFGTYCQAISKYCPDVGQGIPSGTCVPLNPNNVTKVKARGCVTPFAFTAKNWTINAPMVHTQNSTLTAWNKGAMDDFYLAEDSGLDPFGYYNGTTIPIYWDLAEQYAIGDNYYSTLPSYTLPNRWHLVAGTAPAAIAVKTMGWGDINGAGLAHPSSFANRSLYLNEANATPTIEAQLVNATNISWKWYELRIGTDYGRAIDSTQDNSTTLGVAYNYFSPLSARALSYTKAVSAHFVDNSEFYTDARNGQLPNISWVVPLDQDNDHPPQNSSWAQGWVASVVNAVESSPEWNHTAIYITYDEYGGFYDNVAPPKVNGSMLGFRIPLFVISPYTPRGLINSWQCYLDCLLHVVDQRFGLPCLTPIVCNSSLLTGYFNWSMKIRPPMLFPSNVSNASYPMVPQASTAAWEPLPPYAPPSYYLSTREFGYPGD